jgi:hypothetical protein
MAVEDEIPLEVKQQVLAATLRPLEHSRVELPGSEARRSPLPWRPDGYLPTGQGLVQLASDP